MARKPNVFPSYLLHQPTGQARVRIAGRDHYLGSYEAVEKGVWNSPAAHLRRVSAPPPKFQTHFSTHCYGSDESRIRYGELVSKLAGGLPIDPFATPKRGNTTTIEPEAGLTTANEVVLAFMRHADRHYVKNGKPTSEIHCPKSVIQKPGGTACMHPGMFVPASVPC